MDIPGTDCYLEGRIRLRGDEEYDCVGGGRGEQMSLRHEDAVVARTWSPPKKAIVPDAKIIESRRFVRRPVLLDLSLAANKSLSHLHLLAHHSPNARRHKLP